ncbi:MAG TPA: hypothetical protein VJB57_06045 [Dehalococcoidia bacterium]|nr:hypothetical protein [Dehalococcoidia bacterium]
MQWLDIFLSIAASGDFILASLSCIWLAGGARQAPTRARRVGASVLALVSAGLALEAALFLSQAPAASSSTRLAATVVVRGVLLAATALVAALVWRGLVSRR